MKYTHIILASSIMLSSCFSWAMFHRLAAASTSCSMRLMHQADARAHLSSIQHSEVIKLKLELEQKEADLAYTKNNFNWRLFFKGGAISGGLSGCTALVALLSMHHQPYPHFESMALLGAVAVANVAFYKSLKKAAVENMQSDITKLSAQLQALQKAASERILDTE